ncbi:MAG: hypothetical protein ABSA30_12850 [Candidatus Aminicenantales bacterium]
MALIDADYPDKVAVLQWLEPDRRIPMILMREEDAANPRILRGAAAVLSKPVDPNKVRAAVELLVPDWEEPLDREPRLADIPDPFGPENPGPDSPPLPAPTAEKTPGGPVPDAFSIPPESEPPVISAPARTPFLPEPIPETVESLCASSATSTIKKGRPSRRIFRAARPEALAGGRGSG